VLTSSAVDNSIGGVMVIVLTSSAVDNSIGGVMVIVLTSSAVDCVFAASPL
jgi:hypothetical protein